jgi:hypothetical protein
VKITSSKVYVFDDTIILCPNNAKSARGFDPTVAIGIRGSGYKCARRTYAVEGIGNCCISRFSFVAFVWIEGTGSPH